MSAEPTVSFEEQVTVARRFPEEVATEGRIDTIDEICTEDVIDHTPMWEVHGRAALKEQVEALRGAFDDFSATVEDVVADADTVAMRVTLRGTHTGSFMGIEPTGRRFEVGNAVFARIEDGRIAERWVLPDTLGLFRQLGVEELPSLPVE